MLVANHAMLSASGAKRWMTCTPSAVYEQQFPSSESDYADEGTLAHSLGELMIEHLAYGTPLDVRVKKLQEHKFYSEEMMEFVTEYANFVIEAVREFKGPCELILEQKLDLREFIREGFGTVDVGIVGDHVLRTIDLKYGKGVPVDAFENEQQMVYALGMLLEYGMLYNIKVIQMTIYQPRIGNISTYEITTENLLKWGYETLKPVAKIAWSGEGEFIAGDHCRFCRARSICKTNAAHNLVLAGKDFAPPQEITDLQVVKILARAQSMKRWITSVEEMALKMALTGKKWPGMKVVQGRSVRKYKDEQTIIKGLIEAGYEEDLIINKKILGITNLSKIITKLHFKEIVESHVSKPPGSPALTWDEDPRPEYFTADNAAEDFDDDQEF